MHAECASPRDVDFQGPILLRLSWALTGDAIAEFTIDEDATIGHFRSKLNRYLEWYNDKKFLLTEDEDNRVFVFTDEYQRFMETRNVRDSIRFENGQRVLEVTLLVDADGPSD